MRHQSDGQWYYNAVALHDAKGKAQDSYERPDQQASSSIAPIAGLSDFIRRPLARVKPDAVSKMVNPATGEPLVVYHGTRSDFSEFKGSRQTGGLVFVTDAPSVASGYASEGGGWYSAGDAADKIMLDAFLEDFPNPTDADFAEAADSDYLPAYINSRAAAQEFLARLGDGGNVMPLYVKAERPMGSRENPIPWLEAERMGAAEIKSRGFDSVWVTEQGGVALAVVDPTQLKSAIGNNGPDKLHGQHLFIAEGRGKATSTQRGMHHRSIARTDLTVGVDNEIFEGHVVLRRCVGLEKSDDTPICTHVPPLSQRWLHSSKVARRVF